jgi:hypothetical protein
LKGFTAPLDGLVVDLPVLPAFAVAMQDTVKVNSYNHAYRLEIRKGQVFTE